MNNLGILGIQETHLDQDSAAQFNNVFGHRLKPFFSAHPDEPTSTAGVAFVLNKKFVDTENIKEYQLIPGRALTIVAPWQRESLTILNLYAPNRPEERDKMGKKLWEKWDHTTFASK
jgi:exonuclease III